METYFRVMELHENACDNILSWKDDVMHLGVFKLREVPQNIKCSSFLFHVDKKFLYLYLNRRIILGFLITNFILLLHNEVDIKKCQQHRSIKKKDTIKAKLIQAGGTEYMDTRHNLLRKYFFKFFFTFFFLLQFNFSFKTGLILTRILN